MPYIYNDADIEQAELIEQANRIAMIEASGVCTHQGVEGRGDGNGPLPGGIYRESQRDIPAGHLKCHGCDALFASHEEWLDASDAAMA